jgi:hypothetical protein
VSGPAEVGLEDLTDVHALADTERVQDHVDGGAVLEVGHVFDGQDAGDDALVAVAAGHLVTHGDLAHLRDRDVVLLDDAGLELVAVLAAEDLDADDLAALAVGQAEGGVFDVAGLLAKDGAEQLLFGAELLLALGGNLADQDVAGGDFGADAHDAVLVEVLERLFGDVGDVAGDLLRSELGVADVNGVGFDVDRGVAVVVDEALREDDGVLKVVALPVHEGDEDVLAEANSPSSVDIPSTRTSPFLISSPAATTHFWWMEVPTLLRAKLVSS